MDLQKEREAFERYCFEVLLMSPSDGHFERELEDPEFYESVDTHRLWKLWQAKAQATPEGFVLVSQKELLELVIAINAVDLATHTEGKPNEVREMWQQVALKLGAICSTGANQ